MLTRCPSLPLLCLTSHPSHLCGQNRSSLWWHRAYSPGQPEAALLHWQGWTHVPLHPQLPQDVQAPHPRWLQSEWKSILETVNSHQPVSTPTTLTHTMNAKAMECLWSPVLSLNRCETLPMLETKYQDCSKQSSALMHLFIMGCSLLPSSHRFPFRYVREAISLHLWCPWPHCMC